MGTVYDQRMEITILHLTPTLMQIFGQYCSDTYVRLKEELPVSSQTHGVHLRVVRLWVGWKGHSCDVLILSWFLRSQYPKQL